MSDSTSTLGPRREGLVRLGVLGGALALLLPLSRTAAPGSGVGEITLASVGFVILAAFTVGELGRSVRLPRITGYILSGVLLGPRVSDLLSSEVVETMAVFNTLALGLIALTAGLELAWTEIRKVARTLVVTLAAKIPLLIAAIGGTFVVLEPVVAPFGLPDLEVRLAVAAILGVLGLGTSPAIVLAVSTESGSKGRLTDLALGMAVVKDLVVVVALAVALAVGRGLLDPEASFGIEALATVAEELLGSIAFGAAIGVVLIGYVRFVRQQMLLVITAVVLVGAEAAGRLHLELLLVFIAAGFVVRNFSSQGERLHHPLEQVSLPVFVVFFTTAGAAVDLQATLELLPMAAALVAARTIANYLAAQVGGWVGGEPEGPRRFAWLTYWPQAGVTLGLVTLAAERLPTVADPLERTGFAVVALNLLIGPIALGIGLQRAGEAVPPRARTRADSRVGQPSEEDASPGPTPIPDLPEPKPPIGASVRALLTTDPPKTDVETLAAGIERTIDAFVDDRVAPFATESTRLALRILGNAQDPSGVIAGVRRALGDEVRAPESAAWADAANGLREALLDPVLALPPRAVAPLGDDLLLHREGDRLATRVRKRLLRWSRQLSHRAGRKRVVPLRVLGRHALELRLIEGVRALGRTSFEHHAIVLDEVRAVIEGQSHPDEARRRIERWGTRWVEASRLALQTPAREGLAELVELAADAGAPGSAARRVRLSRQQTAITTARARSARDPERWQRLADAGIATLRAEALLAEAEDRVTSTLEQRVQAPLAQLDPGLIGVVRQVAARLETVLEDLTAADPGAVDLEAARTKARSSVKQKEKRQLRVSAAAFGKATRSHQLPNDFAGLLGAAPERLSVLIEAPSFVAGDRPQVVEVPLRGALEDCLGRLAARVRECLVAVEQQVQLAERLPELVKVAGYGLSSALDLEEDPEVRRSTAIRSITRARDLVTGLADRLEAEVGKVEALARKAAEDARTELKKMLSGRRDTGTVARVGRTVRARGRALRERLGRFSVTGSLWAGGLGRGLLERAGLIPPAPPPRDLGALRRELQPHARPIRSLDLPAVYVRAFDLGPLGDPRLAVAQGEVLATLRKQLEAGPGVHTLVEGEPGSGRTSLLTVLTHPIKKRVVFVGSAYHPREEGLVGALASELGCPDYPIAVSQALAAQETVVLVDDLPHHVTPDPRGIHELEELLRVVVDTSHAVSWVVTSLPGYADALRERVPLLGVFTERCRLPPVDGPTLEAVVTARSHLSGLDVVYPRVGIGRAAHRTRRGRARYFERLAETARGNLRSALVLHLRSLQRDGEDLLRARWPVPPPPARLDGLDARTVACLTAIARLGPLDERELAEYLHLGPEEVRGHTHGLVQADLLFRPETRALSLSRGMQQSILTGLGQLGLWEPAR